MPTTWQKVTDDQVIEALKTMTVKAAAEHLGIHERRMWARKAALAKKGWSPDHDMTRTVPDGFKVKGVSTLYNKDGILAAQWVKSTADHERQYQMMVEAVAALSEDIPRVSLMASPAPAGYTLLNVYTITDYHFGMLAWKPETGDDWDTDIAEQMLVDWFAAAISQSPHAQSCVLAQLGDFLHFDGLESITPTSGHNLDADTRFTRLVRVVIRTIARVIDMLLSKYQNVYVLMAEGNHDLAASVWLRELFAARYELEPRITVETRPDPYYCYEHGDTSIFWHHGHKHKMVGLDAVFVAKFREVFGRTKHSYAHTGHLHHRDLKETNLMIVEQHRTLAGSDAYASRGGWVSGRSSTVITYHKEFGEVGRITISPDMLK
jgi:hypothetical protein